MGEMSLHWMTVGYVSPGAKIAIEECGGKVEMLEHKPPFIAAGIAYDPAGAQVWSSGNKQFEQKTGLEFWMSYERGAEIQEPSTGIVLQWGPRNVEFQSVDDTYLILRDEEYDPLTRQVKDPETALAEPESSGDQGDDYDPFLDFDESLP